MNVDEFKAAVGEHWHLVAGPVDAYLNEILITTAAGSTLSSNAPAEMGAQKAVAKIIRDFRSAGKKPTAKTREPLTRPLKRNQTTPDPKDTTTPK